MNVFNLLQFIAAHFREDNAKIMMCAQSGSTVDQWLKHWSTVLEVPGEKNSVSEHASLLVNSRNDMNTVRRPSDRDVNWRPPVQGQPSHVQIKDP